MRSLTLKRPSKLVRKSGTMKASRTLKTLWSPLSIKPDIMGSGRVVGSPTSNRSG